jgi:hypothetical protein
MPKFIGIVIVWVLLMISVLFAYIAGALLSVVQAVSLSIFLGLGKACIVVSLVPGVSLAKSWARSLAQVAAWSTVGGVVMGLLGQQNIAIGQLIVAGQFVPLLQASAHFVILALVTLAVPIITAKLFSGGAAGLSEVLPGLLAARSLATGFANRVSNRRDSGAGRGGAAPSAASATSAPTRVHKVPYERGQRPAEAATAQPEADSVRGRQERAGALFRRLPLAGSPADGPARASAAVSSPQQPPRPPVSEHDAPTKPAPRTPPPPPRPRRERAEADTLLDHHIEVTGETA